MVASTADNLVQSNELESLLTDLALIEFFPKRVTDSSPASPRENSIPIKMFVNPETDRLLLLAIGGSLRTHLVPAPFLQASKLFKMGFSYGGTGELTIETLKHLLTERLASACQVLDTQGCDDSPAKLFAFYFLMRDYPMGEESREVVERTMRLLGKNLPLPEMLRLAEYNIPESEIKNCQGVPSEWLGNLYEAFPKVEAKP